MCGVGGVIPVLQVGRLRPRMEKELRLCQVELWSFPALASHSGDYSSFDLSCTVAVLRASSAL